MNERTNSLRLAAGVAALAAVGNLLLAIAHTGADVPILSSLGPSGGAVPPAVGAFALGTLIFAAVAVGVARAARWAWGLGLVVAGLSILSGIGQFRGVVSAIGIVVAVVLAGLLLTPSSREGLT